MLSLAHISLLPLTPPELVEAAASAGFDAVGLRLEPATPQDTRFPMQSGSPMMRETKARLADTGLKVLDIEVFRLVSGMSFERYLPALEAAAELGGIDLLTTCDVADEAEAVDLMSEACRITAPLGLFVNLEFMPWIAVNDLARARSIVAKVNDPNGVFLLDTLHIHRSKVPVDQLSAVRSGETRYIQLCDATIPPLDFETMLFQARFERLMPGEGVIPISDYLARLPKGMPVSAEVPMRGRMQEVGPKALAAQAAQTCRAALDAAGWWSA